MRRAVQLLGTLSIPWTLVFALLVAGTVGAEEPKVTSLMTKALPELPDKEKR